MKPFEKRFRMKITVDVSKVVVNEEYSIDENHFGIPWRLQFRNRNNHLYIFLKCTRSADIEIWEIDTKMELGIVSSAGPFLELCCHRSYNNKIKDGASWGHDSFADWNDIEKIHSADGKVSLEAGARIKKLTGFGSEKLRLFDESNKKFSDIVLVVDGQKFYVSKLFMASQSTYFESLLMGDIGTEVVLKDVDREDFQSFLEILHGESSIHDYNIDGVLHLAVMYNATVALRRCEGFLRKECKWSIEEKLALASRYNMKSLQVALESEYRDTQSNSYD